MYKLKKVGKIDVIHRMKAASILHACGKDMAGKYDFHHWDNSYLKTLLIVGLLAPKYDLFLVYDNDEPVATFMMQIDSDVARPAKLGTSPDASGRGIGSYCVEMFEVIAKRSGCSKVVLEAYAPHKDLVSFYELRGYVITGTVNTLKYKEIQMEKTI